MGKTTIEWVKGADGQGMTWNPVRGCSRISPGCGGGGSYSGTDSQRGGCYAEGIAARFSGPGKPFHGFAEMTPHGPRWTGKVELIPEKLDEPLRRQKPTTWFMSMFDLFHEALSNEDIAAIFGVMAACRQHTFQVLTKRAERLPEWFEWVRQNGCPRTWVAQAAGDVLSAQFPLPSRHDQALAAVLAAPDWPLPNVWLGVSVEDVKRKTRIDHLRRTPAAVRFLSLEPLLEDLGELYIPSFDQVIVGAESGHGARPMFEAWVRRIRDQALAQGVRFFYKQRLDAKGHKVSLPVLDGRRWAEMPESR